MNGRLGAEQQDKLTRAFQMLDTTRTGQLDQQSVKMLLRALDVPLLVRRAPLPLSVAAGIARERDAGRSRRHQLDEAARECALRPRPHPARPRA